MSGLKLVDGYRVDPDLGIVYGIKGSPIRKVNSRGYIQVENHGITYGVVHRIIWEACNGPIPEHLQINHKNGIKTDNRIDNLELVTPSENTKHAYRLGLRNANGEKNGRYIHGRYIGKAANRKKVTND